MNKTQSTSISILFDYIQFPLRDPDWKRKLGIGMLIGAAGIIIPVLPWILIAGYAVRIAEDLIDQGDQPRLPEWTDYGGLFKDGLRIAGAMATLVLPLVVLLFLGYGVIFGSVFGAASSDSNGLNPAVLLSIALGGCLVVLVVILAIATGLAMPAALGHVTAKRSYRAVFAVKEWSAIWRANMSGFLVSYLVLIVVGFALGLAMNILVLTICLSLFAIGGAMMLTSILNAALGAREYRIGRQRMWEKLGLEKAPAAPLPPRTEATSERTAVKLPTAPEAVIPVAQATPAVPARPTVPATPATPAVEPDATPKANAMEGMQTVVSYDREALLGEMKEKTDQTEPGLVEAGAAAAAATMATVMARREDILKDVLPQEKTEEIALPEAPLVVEPVREEKTEEIVLPKSPEVEEPAISSEAPVVDENPPLAKMEAEGAPAPVLEILEPAVISEVPAVVENPPLPPLTEEGEEAATPLAALEAAEKPAKKRRDKPVKKVEEEAVLPPADAAAAVLPVPDEPAEMGTMVMDRAALLQTPPATGEEPAPQDESGEESTPPAPPQALPGDESQEGGATMIYDRDAMLGLLKKADADQKDQDEADEKKDDVG